MSSERPIYKNARIILMKQKYDDKVFCIGFQKTGTTSIGSALEILGYRVIGPVGVDHPEISTIAKELAFEQIDKFDAFQDNPYPILYKELDQSFPNSKFILTTRSRESWIKSVVNYFGGRTSPMQEWIYGGVGDPIGNEDIFLARYDKHYSEVLNYFEGREADLLIIDIIEEDEKWEKLCNFLDTEIPNTPFPHENRKGYTLTQRILIELSPRPIKLWRNYRGRRLALLKYAIEYVPRKIRAVF